MSSREGLGFKEFADRMDGSRLILDVLFKHNAPTDITENTRQQITEMRKAEPVYYAFYVESRLGNVSLDLVLASNVSSTGGPIEVDYPIPGNVDV